MIKFVPYSDDIKADVLELKVSEDQLTFVGLIEAIIEFPERGADTYIVKVEDDFVGTFSLDRCYGEKYDFADSLNLGFRAFFIDENHQGKGFGGATLKALKSLVEQSYSEFDEVVLTVNCRNKPAYVLYKKFGFEDDGELYHGGMAGPQHIMRYRWK